MQAKVLPVLASIISHYNSNSPILVEGALDLVGALLKPAAPEQAQQMHGLLAQPVQALLMQHDDPGVLQSASQYLKSVCIVTCLSQRVYCNSSGRGWGKGLERG